jgi:hypothetical protein
MAPPCSEEWLADWIGDILLYKSTPLTESTKTSPYSFQNRGPKSPFMGINLTVCSWPNSAIQCCINTPR